ncbi:electron transfer flavoprotein subunit alpha/FixB family protein [Chloroflexota bacterium]
MSYQSKEGSQVWVWVECHEGNLAKVSLGLLGKGRELCHQSGGGEVVAVLVGTDSPELAAELINYGADKVYLDNDSCLSPFDTESCAHFMTGLIQKNQPEIVLWGATSLGREIASRVAAKLGTGLTAHCIDLYIEEIDGKGQLVTMVAGWGGNMTLKIICPQQRPPMAAVKPGIFAPPVPNKRSGEIIPVEVEDKASRLDIVEVVEEQAKATSLEEAEVVVVGGWGLNSSGGFQDVDELAQILKGSVAGTRPAVDAGWIPVERMVGQSGKTVSPQLLVTLGVSGAAQFATGVLSSRFILALDKDPHAPIFEMADIGIVGDIKEVAPLLIDRLREIKEKTYVAPS